MENIRVSVLHNTEKVCGSQILLLIITQSMLDKMYGHKNSNIQDSVSFCIY